MAEERDRRFSMLRDLVRETGLEANEHPPVERLFAYQEGLLSGVEETELQDHLTLCPDCTRMVLELSGAVEPEVPDAETALPEERMAKLWPAMRRRLPRPFPSLEAAPRRRSFERLALPLAASLFLATAGASLWSWSLLQRNRELASPRVNVEVRDLVPLGEEREARRGRGDEAGVPRGAQAVLLILNSADLRSFPSYRAEIRELPSGKVLWAGSGLRRSARGNFTLQLPLPLPGSGRYRIQLLGVEGDRREPLATYEVDLSAAR
jgi:Putative zinc-finger